jgi:hypothetical protein
MVANGKNRKARIF